jgi:hypothetical protein
VVAFAAAGFVVPAFDAEAPVGLAAPGFEVALEAAAPVDLAAPGFEDAFDVEAPVGLAAPGFEVADAFATVLVLCPCQR